MKKQTMQDERVVAQRHKIGSEAYGILMIVLAIAMVVQQFLLDAPFEQYAVEFICFIGMSIYVMVRYMTLGLNIYGEGKRAKGNNWVISIATGIIATAVNGVLNYGKYAEHYQDNIGFFLAELVIFFISVTASVIVVRSFFNYLNKKRQEKIQKQLDEDEQIE